MYRIFFVKNGFEPVTSCIRDRRTDTVSGGHRLQRGSQNWPQFMPRWFISFPKFAEFNESSAPYRKNSISLPSIQTKKPLPSITSSFLEYVL